MSIIIRSVSNFVEIGRELLEEKYKGKLSPRYEAPQHGVVAQVFRGLAGKKVVTPSKDFSRYVYGLLFPDLLTDH